MRACDIYKYSDIFIVKEIINQLNTLLITQV